MKSTLIVAHRGLSSLYQENTLIAFHKAIELGVDFIGNSLAMGSNKGI